jgi:hypothetical protein
MAVTATAAGNSTPDIEEKNDSYAADLQEEETDLDEECAPKVKKSKEGTGNAGNNNGSTLNLSAAQKLSQIKHAVVPLAPVYKTLDESGMTLGEQRFENRLPPREIKQRTCWTDEEDEALLEGIERNGIGKWQDILSDPQYGCVLANRTNVDLKDRYRNLKKSGKI